MSYPNTVNYFVQNLLNHTTNTYRVRPQGPSSVNAGDTIRFDLPNSTLVDLKQVRFMFNASTTAGANGAVRFPQKAISLVDRVVVYIGGQQVYAGHSNNNEVFHMKETFSSNLDLKQTKIMSHEYLIEATNFSDGSTLTTTETSAGDVPFMITGTGLCGFFDSEPRILDTSLVGNITVEITLAGNNILSVGNTATDMATAHASGSAGSWAMTNARMLVTAYGLNDGRYDALIESQIIKEGSLSFAYKQYYVWNDVFSGTSRFALSGVSCLNKLFAGFHIATYNANPLPAAVCASYNTTATNQLPHLVGRKLQSKYFQYQRPSGLTSLRYQLNGNYYPSFDAVVPGECFAITSECFDSWKNGMEVLSLDQYSKDHFIFGKRFDHPDVSMRVLSGMDFSSVNVAGFLESTGSFTAVNVIIVADTTAVLKIGTQLQIQNIR